MPADLHVSAKNAGVFEQDLETDRDEDDPAEHLCSFFQQFACLIADHNAGKGQDESRAADESGSA